MTRPATGTRLVTGLSTLAAAAGAFFLFAAFEARSRRDPVHVVLGGTRHEVARLRAEVVAAPTCPSAHSMVIDVDLDDSSDLYVVGCGRHGFVKSRGGRAVWVDLGDVDPDDTPGLRSVWAREIRGGGRRFGVAGVGLCLAAVSGMAWLVVRAVRRKSQ